jgi:hypothetical protein
MSKIEKSTIDKSKWNSGPWMDEPDRVEWTDETTGYPCIVLRNDMGHLCGYVAVPPGHPAHGTDPTCSSRWDDETQTLVETPCSYDHISVHGGITYASACHGDVCHVPGPGEPDNVWWLGFDAAHSGDLSPRHFEGMSKEFYSLRSRETYRTVEYMKAECASLARQLADVARGEGS